MATYNTVVEDDREAPIRGDILEAIFSHVPLIHLVPASHVSNTWKRAVSASLRHVNPAKPWLTVHTQSPRAPHVTNTFAYDPRSRAWLEIHAPHPNHSAALRASHSTLLYTLSPSEFAFSLDPLRLKWHHARAPSVWRTDPIVARVGNSFVVAGGASDFEDDPLAVEVYDLQSRAWSRCESMPEMLKRSTASTWHSVALAGEKMHVTEKSSGVTHSFDCATMTWQGPYDLRPDENVFYCVTGTIRGRLMVAGMVGDNENVSEVKLWEVKGELGLGSELGFWCEEFGAAPKEMVVKLMGADGCSCGAVGSIEVNWIGDFVYFRNRTEPEEMVVCVVGSGGGCEWGSVRNVTVNDASRMGRMVFCGGHVGVEDLQRAIKENCRFVEKVT
ncbi:F-box/kelch-repeat protein [Spatholobus suberectus]|nr:F-box/kelch-repeat protein [Spatholobus suberectus]